MHYFFVFLGGGDSTAAGAPVGKFTPGSTTAISEGSKPKRSKGSGGSGGTTTTPGDGDDRQLIEDRQGQIYSSHFILLCLEENT